MGGIFMIIKLTQLFIGGIGGYLYIMWMPVHFPIGMSEFILEVLMDPIRFFAAAIAFVAAFLNVAALIKTGFEKISSGLNEIKTDKAGLVVCLIVPPLFFFFWQLDKHHTLLLFCFALLYGIISIDFKRNS
jgi:hypothetical protein